MRAFFVKKLRPVKPLKQLGKWCRKMKKQGWRSELVARCYAEEKPVVPLNSVL